MSQRFSRSDLETVKYVLILFKNVETGARIGEDLKPLFEKLRKRLHAMEFYDFLSGALIRKSKVREENNLDAIIEDQKCRRIFDTPTPLPAQHLNICIKVSVFTLWSFTISCLEFLSVNLRCLKKMVWMPSSRTKNTRRSFPTPTPLPTEHLSMCIKVLSLLKVLQLYRRRNPH